MLFNSVTFFIFFAIVYSLYRVLPHKGQNTLLLIASYVFYGWWDIRFLFLIVVQTVLDFSGGLVIHHGSITKRERLSASVWVVACAFAFVVVQWSKVSFNLDWFATSWRDAFSWKSGWLVFFATCVLTLVSNLVYVVLSPLEAEKKRKLFLTCSIGGNLVILGFFKYFNFFIDNLEVVLRDLNVNPAIFHLDIVLPVGISFYTFQTMSYTIDIYRGKLVPTNRLTDFALFVTFFPHLVAGPIMKAHDLLPQLINKRRITNEQTIRGLHLILYGFFKKIVIADGVARTANEVFATSAHLSWTDGVVGTLCFALQIYCDFSGYSDIARGTANLLGVELMRNFHFPYFAKNPSDFWNRWHISLSTWLKEYLYFPLGGNRKGTVKTYRNLILTMLLGGIWHGAAWNFVLWGLYHGILLCLHRVKEAIWTIKRFSDNPLAKALNIAFFFCLTCYGWILFRAHSVQQIKELTSTLFLAFGDFHLNVSLPTPAALVGLPVFFLAEFTGYLHDGKGMSEVFPVPVWTAMYSAMVFALILGVGYVPSQFIYFVF